MTAPEAAPIPAEVRKLAEASLPSWYRAGYHVTHEAWVNAIASAIMQDREARASQEERIREDERDALFLAAERAKRRHIRSWIGMRGGMFPADRARLRGDAS